MDYRIFNMCIILLCNNPTKFELNGIKASLYTLYNVQFDLFHAAVINLEIG